VLKDVGVVWRLSVGTLAICVTGTGTAAAGTADAGAWIANPDMETAWVMARRMAKMVFIVTVMMI